MCLKWDLLFLLIIFLLPLANAESTFFDNPDDAFIMGNTPSESPAIIKGGCNYDWNCADWSQCLLSWKQVRNCDNIGTCSDTYNPPKIEQNCIYIPKKSEQNKTEIKNLSESEPQDYFPKEKIFNWSYLWLLLIIFLFFIIFKFRKKIKNLINGLDKKYNKNSIKELINKKVYTDEGHKVGNVEEALLRQNKIYGLKIKIDKRHNFTAKKIIIKYKDIKSIGKIVLIDNLVLGNLKKS